MSMFLPQQIEHLVVPRPSGDGPPPTAFVRPPRAPSAAAPPPAPQAQRPYILLAYALVIVGIVAGWLLYSTLKPSPPVAVAGLGAFSALYVAAQAIERLFEPLSEWTGTLLGAIEVPTEAAATDGTQDKEPVHGQTALKARRALAVTSAINQSLSDLVAPWSPTAETKAANAALAQAAVEQFRRNSAVLLWGAASALGITLSGALGLAMLHTVGVSGAPMVLDIIVTGLAIGGGTKPLHDLISNLQSSSAAKKDPAVVGRG